MDVEVAILKTPTRKDKLKVDGYLYTKERNREDRFYWKCSQWRIASCNARVVTVLKKNVHTLLSYDNVTHSHTSTVNKLKIFKKSGNNIFNLNNNVTSRDFATMPTSKIVRLLRQIKGLTIKKTDSTQSKKPDYSADSVSSADFGDTLPRAEVVFTQIRLCKDDMSIVTKKPEESDESVGMDSDAESAKDCSENYVPANRLRKYTTAALAKNKAKISTSGRVQKKQCSVVEIKTKSEYICLTCQNHLPSYKALKHHMRTNKYCKYLNMTCGVCDKSFESRTALYQHFLSHRDKTEYICDGCGKTYTNQFNLENHKAARHGDHIKESGSVYRCKICLVIFKNRWDLNEHRIQHKFMCSICRKTFPSRNSLRLHYHNHDNIKPFPCDRCRMSFHTEYALILHSYRHMAIRPFVCDLCDKAFARKGSLIRHVHLHTGDEIIYHCHICLEHFPTIPKLRTHVAIHSE